MGPNLLFHLGGGEGGIQHFMEHLSGPVATWWKDLGTITEFSPEVKQTIVNGVLKEANGRSIAELERERDSMLLELLTTRSKAEEGARTSLGQTLRPIKSVPSLYAENRKLRTEDDLRSLSRPGIAILSRPNRTCS